MEIITNGIWKHSALGSEDQSSHQLEQSKELIISRRRFKSVTYSAGPFIPGAEPGTATRVLGWLSLLVLRWGHLDQLISSCASSIFALRTLRAHGLRLPQLHSWSTTVASLLYARGLRVQQFCCPTRTRNTRPLSVPVPDPYSKLLSDPTGTRGYTRTRQ